MPIVLDPLPDAELAAVSWLRGMPEVVALVPVAQITTELPSTPTWPALTVTLVADAPAVRRRLSAATLQISAWGDPTDVDGKAAAGLLARTARVALLAMEGQNVTGGRCTAVDDDLPLSWLPDDSRDPTIPRYVVGVTLHLHP